MATTATTATTGTTTAFSPLDPVAQADPYPFYAALRQGPAATYLAEDDLWVVPRYDHVWQIAREPESYSSKALRAFGAGAVTTRYRPRPDLRELDSKLSRSLIATDPPDHTRMRRLVSRPFTPRSIATLQARTREICNDLVEEMIAAGEDGTADLVTHLAFPLPVMVIAEALGVPPELRHDFKRWSNALVGQLDGAAEGEKLERIKTDLREMGEFFRDVIADRTANPRDDLISWIIAGASDTGEGGAPLEVRDLVAFCTLLLVAGNETTTNLLGNLYQAFFDNPDQYRRANQLADLSPVVEEALRYDTSIQGILRLTNHKLRLGDTELPEDALVMILFGSANRDESRWPDGDRFDVDRPAVDNLGFGSGIHRCLGAHLARLELTVAVDVLRQRLAELTPRGPGERVRSVILRGFTSLPVSLRAR